MGDLNTGDELFQYLTDLTGFTQFQTFSGGQKIELSGVQSSIRDLRIGQGALLLQKTPNSSENAPAGQRRPTSPIDTSIIDHFDELYELLDLDERLAKEVYAFLDLFPVQGRVRDLIRSMDSAADQLLPANKPYRLLYSSKALRSCIEDEAFAPAPNGEFLRYAVRVVRATLGRTELLQAHEALYTLIAHVLVECLLLALRAPVASYALTSCIPDPMTYTRHMMTVLENVRTCQTIEPYAVAPHLLIREPFAALLEGTLHDEKVWDNLPGDHTFAQILKKTLLEDPRVEVRKSIADVVFGLSGPPSTKVSFKATNPRSARSRFPESRVDSSLAKLWGALLSALPEAVTWPSQSQEIFEVALAVWRCVAKSVTPEDMVAYFERFGELLLGYHQKDVIAGHEDDYVVWGFTKLLTDCHESLRKANATIPGGSHLARQLLSTLLFPPLSEDGSPETGSRVPVLKDTVRSDLHDLVLCLIESQDDFDAMVDSMWGLIARDQYFDPSVQNERQALRSSVGYAGLRNLGNTCYLNSLFTQLFMNPQFREFLFQSPIVNEDSQKLLMELSKVFSHMQNTWAKSVDPSAAVQSIITYESQNIDVSVQMDVDEFFNLLFDRLENQVHGLEAKAEFKSLYGGQLVQQIKSKECHHISERLEPFSAIQCEIKGKVRLEESLKAYVEGEMMQGGNCCAPCP